MQFVRESVRQKWPLDRAYDKTFSSPKRQANIKALHLDKYLIPAQVCTHTNTNVRVSLFGSRVAVTLFVLCAFSPNQYRHSTRGMMHCCNFLFKGSARGPSPPNLNIERLFASFVCVGDVFVCSFHTLHDGCSLGRGALANIEPSQVAKEKPPAWPRRTHNLPRRILVYYAKCFSNQIIHERLFVSRSKNISHRNNGGCRIRERLQR